MNSNDQSQVYETCAMEECDQVPDPGRLFCDNCWFSQTYLSLRNAVVSDSTCERCGGVSKSPLMVLGFSRDGSSIAGCAECAKNYVAQTNGEDTDYSPKSLVVRGKDKTY